jgi:hypothetical protein
LRLVVLIGLVALGEGLWVVDGDRERFVVGIRTRLLMRGPWALHRLPGDFQIVDDLRPRPDRRALTCLRSSFHDFVETWVAPTVTRRLDCQALLLRV